jgi:ABC-type transport system involved in multi-copper enzyme maturation permease subunit
MATRPAQEVSNSVQSKRSTLSAPSPRLLLAVARWELLRTFASRATWLVAAAMFGLFALVMASRVYVSTWGFGDAVVNLQADIPYGSAMRIYYDLPFDLMFPLVLAIVFLAADGVARDWQRRTHELVMATAIPTRAYVWGRYFVVLALSLFFAIELLLAILVLIAFEHAAIGGADYPPAQVGSVMAVWAAMVVPTTIFACSLSFAIGTLLFRRTVLVKLAMALAWFIWISSLPAIVRGNPYDVPQWFLRWDPTYVGLAHTGLYDIYDHAFYQSVIPLELERSGHAVSQAQLLGIFHQLVNELPDSGSWLPPHLVWAAGAICVVGAASFAFRRFQHAGG